MKWRLETTDIEEYNKTQEFFHCTDVRCFFTLQDVWIFLGFKLKKSVSDMQELKEILITV